MTRIKIAPFLLTTSYTGTREVLPESPMVLSAPSLIEGHRSLLVVSCRGEVIAVMFFEKDARPHFGLKENRIGVVSTRVQVLVQLLVLRLPFARRRLGCKV